MSKCKTYWFEKDVIKLEYEVDADYISLYVYTEVDPEEGIYGWSFTQLLEYDDSVEAFNSFRYLSRFMKADGGIEHD